MKEHDMVKVSHLKSDRIIFSNAHSYESHISLLIISVFITHNVRITQLSTFVLLLVMYIITENKLKI
jgi:hypothetical protein